MKREWLRPLEQIPRPEPTVSHHALNSKLALAKEAYAGGVCHMETNRLTSTPSQQHANKPPPGGDAAAGHGVMVAWQRHMTEKIGKVLARTEETAIEIVSVRQLIVRLEGLLEDFWRAQAAADHLGTTPPPHLQLACSGVATFGTPSIADAASRASTLASSRSAVSPRSEGELAKDLQTIVNNSAEVASELRVVRQQVSRVENLLLGHEKQTTESGIAPEDRFGSDLARRLELTFEEKLDGMQQMHSDRLDELMNFCIQNKESELGMRDLFVACQEAVQRLKEWRSSEESMHLQSISRFKEASPVDFLKDLRQSTNSSLAGHALILETQDSPQKPPTRLSTNPELCRELQDIEEDEEARTGFKPEPAIHRCNRIVFWISAMLVILNLAFMGLKVSIGMSSAQNGEEAPAWLRGGEHVFTAAFLIELLMRLSLEKRRFFNGPHTGWNLVDAVLVIFQVFETIHGLGNYTVIRVAILGKVIRVTRLFRVVRGFKHFRLMAMMGAWQPLFWGCVVLVSFIFLFSLLLTQLVEIGLAKKIRMGEQAPAEVFEFYGSLERSMVTLFMGITGGLPWKNLLKPLQDVSPGISEIVFLAYIFVMTFAVMQTVNAVYIDGFINCSDQNRFVAMSETAIKHHRKYEELRRLFQARDLNANGRIRYSEFSVVIHDRHAQEILGVLRLEVHTIMALFRLLEDDKDACSVQIDELIRCLSALQEGGINILLMSTLVFRGQTLLRNISRSFDLMQKNFLRVEDGIGKVEFDNMELLTTHRTQELAHLIT